MAIHFFAHCGEMGENAAVFAFDRTEIMPGFYVALRFEPDFSFDDVIFFFAFNKMDVVRLKAVAVGDVAKAFKRFIG